MPGKKRLQLADGELLLTEAMAALVEPYERMIQGQAATKEQRCGKMWQPNRRRRIERLSEAQNHRCGGCGVRFDEKIKATLEHFICRAWGGTNSWMNLAVTCEPCNKKRGCSVDDVREVYG